MSCGLGHFSPALYNFLYISCAFEFKEFPFLLSDTFVHRAKLTSIQLCCTLLMRDKSSKQLSIIHHHKQYMTHSYMYVCTYNYTVHNIYTYFLVLQLCIEVQIISTFAGTVLVLAKICRRLTYIWIRSRCTCDPCSIWSDSSYYAHTCQFFKPLYGP